MHVKKMVFGLLVLVCCWHIACAMYSGKRPAARGIEITSVCTHKSTPIDKLICEVNALLEKYQQEPLPKSTILIAKTKPADMIEKIKKKIDILCNQVAIKIMLIMQANETESVKGITPEQAEETAKQRFIDWVVAKGREQSGSSSATIIPGAKSIDARFKTAIGTAKTIIKNAKEKDLGAQFDTYINMYTVKSMAKLLDIMTTQAVNSAVLKGKANLEVSIIRASSPLIRTFIDQNMLGSMTQLTLPAKGLSVRAADIKKLANIELPRAPVGYDLPQWWAPPVAAPKGGR